MDIKDIICQAIKEMDIIQFNYDGHLRIVDPFTLGIHKDTGKLLLSAYRVGGYSESEKEPPWRLYTVAKISALTVINSKGKPFITGYNPNDSRMRSIICTR